MWEQRAHRARRDIAVLAAAGLGVSELHAAAIRVVGDVVSGEIRIPPEYEPRLAEAEYSEDEPHTFATLAARRQPMAKLSDLPDRDRHRSARLNTVWRPLGLDRELRVVFLADGACWGAAGMVRAGRDFTGREMEFLAAVAPAIATATRLAVRLPAPRWTPGGHSAIVVVGPARGASRGDPGCPTVAEPARRDRPGRFLVMMQVMATGARAAAAGSFRARVQCAGGQWAVLHASPLIGGDDEQIAVTIEPATGDQLTGLLLVAYGLTARERDVCREVIAGLSTADIAARLFISAHTVQDHLKSVFAKVGVRSRGELVARLRPEDPD